MNRESLIAWAKQLADGPVIHTRDRAISLSSKFVRFQLDGVPTVAVASKDGKDRIDVVANGLAWYYAIAADCDVLNVIVAETDDGPLRTEQRHAIGTLIAHLNGGPEVRAWSLENANQLEPIAATASAFASKTPTRWNQLLIDADDRPVTGFAETLGLAVDHPSFALYPKRSSTDTAEPWQMRLDGLAIGHIGKHTATLRLASTKLDALGEPRETWSEVVGTTDRHFNMSQEADLAALIDALIAKWTDHDQPDAVLRHKQAEHALEAHLLSGRLRIKSPSVGELRLAVPFEHRAVRAAQFPTLWGDVTRPARYLDALLADSRSRPWAIELKDQKRKGPGSYLRDGITQVVLYRHFIRSAPALDPYFDRHELDRANCQAALAFPNAATTAAAAHVKRHRHLAALWNVEVIEFPRPGSTIHESASQ